MAIAVILVRSDGGLDQGGPGKGGKWSDSECILKVEPKWYAKLYDMSIGLQSQTQQWLDNNNNKWYADGLMWNVNERKSSDGDLEGLKWSRVCFYLFIYLFQGLLLDG